MTEINTNGKQQSRDAIVMSGWTWEAVNVPERVALGLAHLGTKVLYCGNPVSRFRTHAQPLTEIERGVYRLTPEFLGHRLNRIPAGLDRLQARIVANQALDAASQLNLRQPVFIYPHGDFFVPLCRIFKEQGFPLVHCCFDYPEPGQHRHIELSDLTLTLSKTVFHQLKAKYGEKIALIPQVRWHSNGTARAAGAAVHELSSIPRPRLGYLGLVSDRLNLRVVERLLVAQPEWHFVHFGESRCLELPNVHAIAWRDQAALNGVIDNLDVGFMPYDCHSNKNFHCMPLKLFDYFLRGLPVVSTPIVNLWEYSDTIYFGDDVADLARAIQSALEEPPDSPLKARRIAIARESSIESLAQALERVLAPWRKDFNGTAA